jgi:hypothetical protein
MPHQQSGYFFTDMTHEEKINYMKIAASITGYGFELSGLDMLVSIYELVVEMRGETDLNSICTVQDAVEYRTTQRRVNNAQPD